MKYGDKHIGRQVKIEELEQLVKDNACLTGDSMWFWKDTQRTKRMHKSARWVNNMAYGNVKRMFLKPVYIYKTNSEIEKEYITDAGNEYFVIYERTDGSTGYVKCTEIAANDQYWEKKEYVARVIEIIKGRGIK